MKTNWWKIVSLVLLGVAIGITIERYFIHPPIQDLTPICLDWVKAITNG